MVNSPNLCSFGPSYFSELPSSRCSTALAVPNFLVSIGVNVSMSLLAVYQSLEPASPIVSFSVLILLDLLDLARLLSVLLTHILPPREAGNHTAPRSKSKA